MTNTHPIGVNILLNHVKDRDRLLSRLKALQPAMIVGTVDNTSDMQLIHTLRTELPNTTVIGRVYHRQDGAYHTKPDDSRYWLASPDDFLNTWGELGKNGGVLYALNEPGTDLDDVAMTRLVQWTCEVIKLANVRNIRVCVLNLGVGHPGLINGEWDKRFDPVLELLSIHRQHFLGLHLYKPDPHRVDRINALIARCNTLGKNVPTIAITEYGWDHGEGEADNLNGYHSRGISGETFARQMLDTWKAYLMPHPEVVGAAIYCAGDNGDWSAFDIESDSAVWDYLIHNPVAVPSPPPILPPVQPPIVPLPPIETPPPAAPFVATTRAMLLAEIATMDAILSECDAQVAAIEAGMQRLKSSLAAFRAYRNSKQQTADALKPAA